MEIYAQGNNTQHYSDDDFEFEFEVELIYDDYSWSDDDREHNGDELIGAQITVENTGQSIDTDILFRAHITNEIPETVPNTYDAEEILYLRDSPLQRDESREVFMDLSQERGGGKVVTVWPLIDSNKLGKTGDTPFVTLVIPKTEISEKLTTNDFKSIKIYPNPTTGILNIHMPENTSINQITIYDKTGQTIKTFGINRYDAVQLDLQDLPQGVYFAAMRNEQEQTIYHSKILIHK